MTKYRALATIGAVILMTAGELTAQSLEGLYRPDYAHAANWTCRAEFLGMDGGAVGIIDGYLEGVENRCELTNPRPGPNANSATYTAICSAEGTSYSEDVVISKTSVGVSIKRGNTTVQWRSCGASKQASSGAPTNKWSFQDGIAGIVHDGNYFGVSCNPVTASSTTPVAHLQGPCPMCPSGEVSQFRLSVDGTQGETFGFEKVSNAAGWISDLYYYPQWFDGLIGDLISGQELAVYDGSSLIAGFPLGGSARALKRLRNECQ